MEPAGELVSHELKLAEVEQPRHAGSGGSGRRCGDAHLERGHERLGQLCFEQRDLRAQRSPGGGLGGNAQRSPGGGLGGNAQRSPGGGLGGNTGARDRSVHIVKNDRRHVASHDRGPYHRGPETPNASAAVHSASSMWIWGTPATPSA